MARIWIFACAAEAWLSQLEAQTKKKRMRMKPDMRMPRVAVYHFILEESLLSLESMTKTKTLMRDGGRRDTEGMRD